MGKRLAGIAISIDDLAAHIDAKKLEDAMAFPRTAEFRYCYMDDSTRSIVFVFEHPDFYEMRNGWALFHWPGEVRDEQGAESKDA